MNLQVATEIYAGGSGSGCHGSNCGRKTVYHGTSVALARRIAKEGLKPKKGSSYVSVGSRVVAYRFAQDSGDGAIVKLRLPPEVVAKLKEDENYPEGAWFLKEKIPVEYVKEVKELREEEK